MYVEVGIAKEVERKVKKEMITYYCTFHRLQVISIHLTTALIMHLIEVDTVLVSN